MHGFFIRLTMSKMKSIVQSTQNLNANHNTWIVDNNCLLKEIVSIQVLCHKAQFYTKCHFKTMEPSNGFEPKIIENLCLISIMKIHMK